MCTVALIARVNNPAWVREQFKALDANIPEKKNKQKNFKIAFYHANIT